MASGSPQPARVTATRREVVVDCHVEAIIQCGAFTVEACSDLGDERRLKLDARVAADVTGALAAVVFISGAAGLVRSVLWRGRERRGDLIAAPIVAGGRRGPTGETIEHRLLRVVPVHEREARVGGGAAGDVE